MPRDGSLVLSDAHVPTLTIVCEPCGRRGQHMLMRGPGESYGDAIIRIARGLVRLAAPLLIMAASDHCEGNLTAVALSPIKHHSALQRPL
jgi:hypothetical protein